MTGTAGKIRITRRHNAGKPEEPREGRYVLQGEVAWRFEGPADKLDGIERALGSCAERVTADVLFVDFGNSLGLLRVEPLGEIEVVSGKMTGADFDRMLTDLVEEASALPFAVDAPTALPYDRSVTASLDVAYHAFVYLRHILSDSAVREDRLLPALNLILRDPHRLFRRELQSVPLELAHRADAQSIHGIITRRHSCVRAEAGPLARHPLTRALGGYLPLRVDQTVVRATLDTAENRFVKSFLRMAQGITEAMRAACTNARRPAFAERIQADCDHLDRLLLPIARHGLWNEVGPVIHFPAASTVLQRRRGYRDVLRHFARLRLASRRIPLNDEQVRDLLEAKDGALLYELWSFFQVVRAVCAQRGARAPGRIVQANDFQVGTERGLALTWADGTRVLYNAAFSRSRSPRSYSVGLRPDVTIEVPDGLNQGLHLLDAKFRLDTLDDVMPTVTSDDTVDQVNAEERRSTFKRGDLYKMHAYRDAIRGARSVWVLYPGDELRFFPVDGPMVRDSKDLPIGLLKGVGAIPLRLAEGGADDLYVTVGRILAGA